MRIATLQFAPAVGAVDENIRRADELLAELQEKVRRFDRQLDLLVLPEMALTGYNFPSAEAITPCLETHGEGPSATWAAKAANKLNCAVCVGYPEVVSDSNEEGVARFNSLYISTPTGTSLLNYQKRFLYYTDERWAKEGRNGEGFFNLPLQSKRPLSFWSDRSSTREEVPTTVGICMDINPYKFEAPWDAYEFSTRVMKSGARLVILSMAWLTTFPEEVFLEEYKGKTPECETFRYWIMRMWPLIVGDEADKDDEDRGMRIVVFANRCGIERRSHEGMDDAVYAGSSCVIGIQALSPGEHRGEKGYAYADVSVWGMLGATEEGSLLVDTEEPPTWTFRVTRKLGAESEGGVEERGWIS